MRCSCRILRGRTPWFNRAEGSKAFSSEVDPGSREENASNKRLYGTR
jgi:hypothetical protein